MRYCALRLFALLFCQLLHRGFRGGGDSAGVSSIGAKMLGEYALLFFIGISRLGNVCGASAHWEGEADGACDLW